MAEVLTVGETMAVLAPLKMGALRYQNTYEIRGAGAESNTAIGLAKLGKSAAWISRLGEDELGERILMALRAEGVDCSAVKRDREYQTGLMFKEMDGRDTRVFYYRKDSAASCMDEFDVEPSWFSGVRIVHLTGITPVLSPSCCRMIQRVALLAERYGVMLSFDPNIRKRLWKNADYTELLRTLTLQAQIVEIGREEAEILFGTREDKAILDALFCEGRAQWVAIKDGGRGAVVADRKERVDIPPFPCSVYETVGAGDGFNAGFLAGILEGRPIAVCGRMGGIVGALATESAGDYEGYPSRSKLERLLAGEEELYR